MYVSHYKLTEKPFQINSDPRFLWLSEVHKEALAVLEYGLINQNGILVLTGDAGTGKTTLINALIDGLDSDVCVAKIVHSKINLMGFLSVVSQSFNIPERFDKIEDFIFHFTNFLERKFIDNIRVLLIVDEAHKLSLEILEQIRLLSNIELEGRNLFCIYLVGQNELTNKLLSREGRAFRQRVTIHHQIKPLSEYETSQYCLHRLKVAGSEIEIFDHKAIAEIYRFSKGYPRLINIICDRALVEGYGEGVRKINQTMIRECFRELRLPGEIKINMTREVSGTLLSASNNISNLVFQAKIPSIYFEIKKQTKHFLGYLFNHLIAKPLFKLSNGLGNKREYGFLIRSHEIISRFMKSGLRSTAFAIGLVALCLIWSLWYQGIFSNESNLTISKNFVMKPNGSASYEIEYRYIPMVETNVVEKTEAIRSAKEPSGKSESDEAGLEKIYKANNLGAIDKVARNTIVETKQTTLPIKKTAENQPSVQKSTDMDRQDVTKSAPPKGYSEGLKTSYSIQVGAFLNQNNAVKMASILGKKGYSAIIVNFNDAKGRVWHTVRIGDYASRRVAQKHAKDFSSKLGLESIVRPAGRF